MASHESQSTTPQDKAKLSSTPSGQDDLKRLKSRFGSQLTTLKELFSDWSDEDLLFAIQDAEGDLELAIDRISEGHVCQWGEVKSKKSKKETAQKAKVAVGTSAPATLHSTTQSNRVERPQAPRGNSERAKRGGRNVRTSKPSTETTPSWGDEAGKQSSHLNASSWASIASKPIADDATWHSTTAEGDNNWNSMSVSAKSSTWTSDSVKNDAATKAKSATLSTSATATPSTGPKTWASLLKSQPKPETTRQSDLDTTTSEWDTPSNKELAIAQTTNEWDAPNDWGKPVDNAEVTSKKDEPPHTTDAWLPSPTNNVSSPTFAEPQTGPTDVTQNKEQKAQEDNAHAGSNTAESNRVLKQDEPVVMPNSTSSIASVGVKFGTLSLDDKPVGDTQESQREPVTTAQPSATSPHNDYQTDNFSQLKQVETSSHQQQSQQQQPQNHPKALHQNAFGSEHINSSMSGYSHPSGPTAFGINPMGALPDYGFYGSEAHRAAAAMGYYDPASYNASPLAAAGSAYRDKNSHEPFPTVNPQHNQSVNPQAQQMYPNNLYYQYYYMQNQYPAYQQAARYGQPYVNKNMYTNMYQQPASGKSNTATTSSPYGAAASPNAQNAYNPSAAVAPGYDDMAGFQQHLGMGLHDYQKQYSSAQHMPGFLGSPGQLSQTTTPSSDNQGSKGNANQLGKTASSVTSSNTQPTSGITNPSHQQAYQQQAMNQGNYFGHTFPYQQQYPQHYPQYQNASYQGQSSQSSGNQEPLMGHQQPYWSQ